MPKFDRYITLEQRRCFLLDLGAVASWIDVPPNMAARRWCRDPADDIFVHTALSAHAGWLVTGDQDLLVLASQLLPLGLSIISPADAARRMNLQF